MHAIFFNEPLEANFLGHQMAEIYKDNVYKPYLAGKSGLTILDIGANIGVTSYYFSQFAKTVYALEPSQMHFDLLVKMLDYNKITNVKAIKKAIYIKSGKMPFGGPKANITARSLHMATWDNGKSDEKVDCTTIEDLIKDNKIERVDLLKLDIEGSETEVLSHTSFKNIAGLISTIIVERHGWSGRNPNQLVEALKSNGFKVGYIPSNADLLVATR